MTSQTSVDVQGMIAAQGHFQNALDQVNTAYTQMAEQQSMLQANWIGETASAFGMALSQWLDDLSVVRAQLGGMVESLSQNTNVYANTNEGSQEMATSFANGLSGVPGLGI
jgi:WXG100 family type VII secretion target